VIHHGLTAELNALRIAELNAEAERRRLKSAVPKRTRRPLARLVAFMRVRVTARRSATASGCLCLDGAAKQST
jgi:hypothetical protein